MIRYRVLALLALLLAGCAASAQTRSASVDVNALLPKHPLYAALGDYDRQIAVLQGTLHTRFSNADAVIEHASSAVQHDLSHTSQFASSAASRTQFASSPVMQSLSKHEPADNIRQNYQSQHAALEGAAQHQMDAYRSALLAQEQHAYQTFVQSVTRRSQEAYDARAQELREKESALLLELARRDAPQRLSLRAKLQTLALTGERRSRLEAQLHAIQAHEDAAVASLRRVDKTVLAAYEKQVRTKADSDIAHMHSSLQARTAATLAARERVLAAQTSNASSLQLPPAAGAANASEMQTAYQSLLNAPRQDTSAYAAASSDLTQHFRSLRSANDADTQSVRSQISSLQHDKSALRKKMIAQIMSQAEKVAKARGYSAVYPASSAPSGSADVTPAVASALQSLAP